MSSTGELYHLSCSLDVLQHVQDTPGETVIASPYGRYIAPQRSFKGRLWQAYFTVKGLFSRGVNCRQQALEKALGKIKDEFSKFLEAQGALETTLHLDVVARPPSFLTQSECDLLRIGNLGRFLTTYRTLYNAEEALAGIQKLYVDTLQNPLLTKDELRKLEHFTRRFALVSIPAVIEMLYPASSFTKLIDKKELTAQEEQAISDWIRAVMAHKSRISVFILHNALLALHDCPDAIALLERQLFLRGLALLGEDDDEHLKWVRTRIEGIKTLELHDKAFSLGKRVHFAALSLCNAGLFTLPETPDRHLFVGRNPAILGIWKNGCDEAARGIMPVQIQDKESLYRFLVVEKVERVLSEIEWKTTSLVIDPEDQLLLKELVDFLAWLACNPTPKDLFVDRVFVVRKNESYRLRVIVPFDESIPHDFGKIEQFVRGCAHNNRYIFRYLMHSSRLNEHRQALHIRALALKKLKGETANVADMCVVEQVHNSDNMQEMIEHIQAVHKQLFDRLEKRLKPSMQAKLTSHIADELIACQKEMGYSYTVDPNLETEQGQLEFEKAFIKKYYWLFK